MHLLWYTCISSCEKNCKFLTPKSAFYSLNCSYVTAFFYNKFFTSWDWYINSKSVKHISVPVHTCTCSSCLKCFKSIMNYNWKLLTCHTVWNMFLLFTLVIWYVEPYTDLLNFAFLKRKYFLFKLFNSLGTCEQQSYLTLFFVCITLKMKLDKLWYIFLRDLIFAETCAKCQMYYGDICQNQHHIVKLYQVLLFLQNTNICFLL